jgi:hypothetical protein
MVEGQVCRAVIKAIMVVILAPFCFRYRRIMVVVSSCRVRAGARWTFELGDDALASAFPSSTPMVEGSRCHRWSIW